MRRFRRTLAAPSLDLVPLVDVVFLLLTFFLFSMVVMVRANVLDLRLPSLPSGAMAESAAVTITVDAAGQVAVDGVGVELETLASAVRARVAALYAEGGPEAVPILFLAADREARHGDFIATMDALKVAGLGDIRVLGATVSVP